MTNGASLDQCGVNKTQFAFVPVRLSRRGDRLVENHHRLTGRLYLDTVQIKKPLYWHFLENLFFLSPAANSFNFDQYGLQQILNSMTLSNE